MKKFLLFACIIFPLHAHENTDKAEDPPRTRRMDKEAEYGLLMRQFTKDIEQFAAIQTQFIAKQCTELKNKAEKFLADMAEQVPGLASCLTCTPDYPSLRTRAYESPIQLIGQIIEDVRQHNLKLVGKLVSHAEHVKAATQALKEQNDNIIAQLHALQRKHRAKMKDTANKILSLFTSAQIKQFIDTNIDKLERMQEQITEKCRQDCAYILRTFEHNAITICMECGTI
jgi:ATP-dependent Lon protease